MFSLTKRILFLVCMIGIVPSAFAADDGKEPEDTVETIESLSNKMFYFWGGGWSGNREKMIHLLQNETPGFEGKTTDWQRTINDLLCHACARGDGQIIDVCIAVGAPVKGAIPSANSRQAVRRLMECKADPNSPRSGGAISLHSARGYALLDELCSLANINKQDDGGRTPLHWHLCALCCGTFEERLNKTCILLSHGADRTIKNKDGKAPVELLLSNQTEINLQLAREIQALSPELIKEIARRAVAADPQEQQYAQEVAALRIVMHTYLSPVLTNLTLEYGGAFTPLPPFVFKHSKIKEK